jgi:hypothetical protein
MMGIPADHWGRKRQNKRRRHCCVYACVSWWGWGHGRHTVSMPMDELASRKRIRIEGVAPAAHQFSTRGCMQSWRAHRSYAKVMGASARLLATSPCSVHWPALADGSCSCRPMCRRSDELLYQPHPNRAALVTYSNTTNVIITSINKLFVVYTPSIIKRIWF